MTPEGYQALMQLERPDPNDERTDEEVGALIVRVYPDIEVHKFVNVFLGAVDLYRFDSDTGHVDCPVACIHALLAYQKAGGRIIM